MNRITKTNTIVSLLLLLLVPFAVSATVTTVNNGDGTTTLRAQYSVPTSVVVDVRDDICRGVGWTATVTCTSALVTASRCTSGQLGTQVPNSETCIQAIDRTVKEFLRGLRKAGEIQEAEDAFVKPVRTLDRTGDIQ